MENFKYKFSVVIPIYNLGNFLEETIHSVINQTIGFEENIQIILVNDGSKDNSEEICLKYKEIYPNNIIYIRQENTGVSAARNNGKQYIEGKYVNFLDGDDKWSLDSFEKVWQFFEKKEMDFDLLACRMQYFDASEKFHPLDYKFISSKVVDITEYYEYTHLHVTSSIIKSDVVKDFEFDTKLKYGEDAKFINEIILQKNKYGVFNEAIHFYRKRSDLSSAIQNKEKNQDWYTNTIQYFYYDLINISIEKNKTIIPYVQHLIMNDLKWRIKSLIPSYLQKDIKEEYIKQIIMLLQKIDDYIICGQKKINAEHKMYILSLKHGRDIRKELVYRKGKLFFENSSIYNLSKNKGIFLVDLLKIENDELLIEGRVNCPLHRDQFNIYAYLNSDKKVKLDLIKAKKSLFNKNTYAFKNDQILYHYTFKIRIPLIELSKLSFIFSYRDETNTKLSIRFKQFSKLSNVSTSYYAKGNYILNYNKKNNIIINKNNRIKRLKKEIKYIIELLFKEKKYGVPFIRLCYFLKKPFIRKDIWLISDREDVADDNGEHFFKYLINKKDKHIKIYFVLKKGSKDYKRLRKIGRVVDPCSLKYKILFLLSSKIISSQANDNTINAFEVEEEYYRGLRNFEFIFLQHGIIKDDLSKWLQRYNKNIKLFVTSAKPEYESIINGDYYYTSEQVKLTGLPRYDNLRDNKEKRIIIIPSHRRKLVEWNKNDKYGRTYNPYFKNSAFFEFYNRLINDKRIIEKIEQKGYKMKFTLHPLLMKQIDDFDINKSVEIIHKIDYQKEFSENALLITDYSSIAFDFAFLKKPVLYTQFDEETFYEGQVYDKGYFDYVEDGFGPVCYDYESTVQEIIKIIENDCVLEEKYLRRIEGFYYKFDTNNCKRVYEEILNLK